MYLDDNPFADNRTAIHRKMVGPAAGGGERVYVDAQARAFSDLPDDALIDTADLCRIFGCSSRTVYRWISAHGLRPVIKVGREFLFTKRAVVDWYAANQPRPGRPPRAGR